MVFFAEADGFLADERSGDGSGWDDQGVDFCIFQGQMELLDELFAELEGGQIDSCGDFGTHFEARADVVAVIGGARGKPSGLLMIVSSFGPGDLVSSVFGFIEQRKRELLQAGALLFQDAERFVEDEVDVLGNHVEEKLFGNAESELAGLGGRIFHRRADWVRL